MNDHACENYNVNSQIRCKVTMLKSSLFDYSDVFIIEKTNITSSQRPDERNKLSYIQKLCAIP